MTVAQPTSSTRSPRPFSDFSGPYRDISYAVPSTCSLFVAPKKPNYFRINKIQPLFAKYPGWGYLCDTSARSAPRRYRSFLSYCPDAKKHTRIAQFWCSLNTFGINTCKSVSRQTTSSPFRMNTYEKPGGGVSLGRGGCGSFDPSWLCCPSLPCRTYP
jgi:hypothetical protein